MDRRIARGRSLTVAAGLACAAALAASAALGQPDTDDPYETPEFQTCLQTHHATADLIKCEVAEEDRQYALLDAAYKARLAHLKGPARDTLVADQAAWSSASDSCVNHRHGRWASVAMQGCKIDQLIQRRLQLQGH
jgi:uncharacterized protein YecT (DUF1311 family)